MIRYMILMAGMYLATASASLGGPSFDCTKATSQIDQAICAWDTVGSLDVEMAAAYQAALTVQADDDERTLVEQDHQRWLTARDEQCALDAVKPDPGSEAGLSPQEFGQLLCLQDVYASHIAHLEDMVPPPLVLTADRWSGKWTGSGEGNLAVTIRRGTAKPDYLVIDLVTAAQGCSGAVTLYGKPDGAVVLGESYDPENRDIPVCRVELSFDDTGLLATEVAGPCTFYHGAACGFDGTLTRDE